ncbi:MAG TPA: HAMP domain-containing sensor histidine kinase, partial [Kofleriaceae bacterium]|nr:HAMP domain-containing sensor histidine kinase [Kofleriaceae bacterium]
PPPRKRREDTRDLNPVLLMIAAVVAAVVVTGGIGSPMLALLPAPLLVGWTMSGTSRESYALGLLAPLALVVIAVTPGAWTDASFGSAGYAAIAAWTTLLSAWMIGRRIRRLFEALREKASSLDRVCAGALFDAASRRRGLESMSTKLAHELKNPLAAIKSLVQLELHNAPDDKRKRRLEVVFAEAERMQTLMRDYLELKRPYDAIHLARVDLGELMEEIRALLAGQAEAAGIELVLAGDQGAIAADSRLLKEAIVNVASNALEATPRGGTVEIAYEVGAAGASIVVRDTGIGMTNEVRERIGTPFFTTRDGGTGLGVVIARTAIAQHRGSLDYASVPGVGTVATIQLPGASA